MSSSRIVAITGASAGIGRACAERLARADHAVVLSARRADRLTAIVRAIVDHGGRAIAVPGDVTNIEDMTRLVDVAIESFGRIDVMIANAGIGYHGAFEETPVAVMQRLVDVNLMGTFYAAHAAVTAFKRQGHGHLIAVSSIVGRRGVGGSSVYSATKAAQVGFIEGLRAEFVGTGLTASLVYPISTSTEFHDVIHRDFGRHVEGAGPRQSADDVARTIEACIAHPRAEVYPYSRAKMLAVLSVTAPRMADRLVQRYRRRSARPHDGDA